MMAPDFTRPGIWQELLAQALRLTDHLSDVVRNPSWSFGGGTVLMLRLNHRFSKDIDLFVPDPQYLGHFSPRLTDVAEALTTEYEEAAEYTKLFLPQGEIDIVVGTSLTENGSVPGTHDTGGIVRRDHRQEDAPPRPSGQGAGPL